MRWLWSSCFVLCTARFSRSLLFVLPCIAALAYLHSKHIAHCDLSLENVLITRSNGRIKVIDFGLAVPTDGMGHSAELMARPPGAGKDNYLAPEVQYCVRCDVVAGLVAAI